MKGECQDCIDGECVGESGGGYRAPNCPHLKDVKVEVPRKPGAANEQDPTLPQAGFCGFRQHAATVHPVRLGGRWLYVCDDCEPLLTAGRAGQNKPPRCAIITKGDSK